MRLAVFQPVAHVFHRPLMRLRVSSSRNHVSVWFQLAFGRDAKLFSAIYAILPPSIALRRAAFAQPQPQTLRRSACSGYVGCMISHISIAKSAGVFLDDLDNLFKGNVTANVAKRLGVNIADVESFIGGSVTAAMARRIGVGPLSAGDELAKVLQKEGRVGFLYALMLQ